MMTLPLARQKTIGITIKPTIGVGDALQFSSLPENYYRATGEKLIDVSRPWFFDCNPYVRRVSSFPDKTVEMWNFSPRQYDFPNPRDEKSMRRPRVYLSNAEIWASVFGVPVTLNRPRLYQFEDYPFYMRDKILLHIDGRSHGTMPDHVIDHIRAKYLSTGYLYQIGQSDKKIPGVPKIETKTLWDLAMVISHSRMLIGMDSGPSWIAACYPDVIVKKLRTKPTPEHFKDWVPLDQMNIHSHWDDRCHQIYNPTEDDIGFTSSYRRI